MADRQAVNDDVPKYVLVGMMLHVLTKLPGMDDDLAERMTENIAALSNDARRAFAVAMLASGLLPPFPEVQFLAWLRGCSAKRARSLTELLTTIRAAQHMDEIIEVLEQEEGDKNHFFQFNETRMLALLCAWPDTRAQAAFDELERLGWVARNPKRALPATPVLIGHSPS
jgi:hypothetical protein